MSHLSPSREAGCNSLVMAGYAGYAGTGILVRMYERELAGQLPGWLIHQAAGYEADAACIEAACTDLARSFACPDETQAFPVEMDRQILCAADGGVLAALWLFAEKFGLGMDVDLRRIPIRQETIEISEILDVNPYQMYGKGAVLIGTERPEILVDELAGRGIRAERIGRIFPGYVRTILNDGTEGYLNVPRHIDRMREGTIEALENLLPK